MVEAGRRPFWTGPFPDLPFGPESGCFRPAGCARPYTLSTMTACPNCGFQNAEFVKFCAECGEKLAGAAVVPRETRRTVTVLFADVTGSTALGEQLDPESLRALMGRYFGAMKEVIERHGGTVEKRRRRHGHLRHPDSPRGRRPAG
jgi:hypothetical protein